jgi:hypothetical protein
VCTVQRQAQANHTALHDEILYITDGFKEHAMVAESAMSALRMFTQKRDELVEVGIIPSSRAHVAASTRDIFTQ